MNTPYREFLETTLERKYLRPKAEKKFNYQEWFIDIVIGGILALAGIAVLAIAAGSLFVAFLLTDRAEAKAPDTNERFCQNLEEGKHQVLGASADEVSEYCSTI